MNQASGAMTRDHPTSRISSALCIVSWNRNPQYHSKLWSWMKEGSPSLSRTSPGQQEQTLDVAYTHGPSFINQPVDEFAFSDFIISREHNTGESAYVNVPQSEYHTIASNVDYSDVGGRDFFAEFATTLAYVFPHNHSEANLTLVSLASRIFTPTKIRIFTNLYFQHFNRHNPYVHQGSFDFSTVSLPLLLVMVIVGAVYSSNSSESDTARALADCVEQIASRNPYFENIASGIGPIPSTIPNVEEQLA